MNMTIHIPEHIEIIPEPMGGAHRNPQQSAENLKIALKVQLAQLAEQSIDDLLDSRYQRYMSYGNFDEA